MSLSVRQAGAPSGSLMDDEAMTGSNGSWHRGHRKQVGFQASCYYTREGELHQGCHWAKRASAEWRSEAQRTAERAILVGLFAATGGGAWRANDNWGTNTDPCWDSWYGVTCDEHGHVVALELSDNNLVGTLPSNLGGLTSLLKLDMSTSAPSYSTHTNRYANKISGPLPSFLRATRIEDIEISGNAFNSWPPDLYLNGKTLRSLSASFNSFTDLPRYLLKMTRLHTLELNNNLINDAFPIDFGYLTNARFVHLQYNQLRGTIPSSIIGMTNIRSLDLSHNAQLTGQIPEAILVRWTENDYVAIMSTSISGYISSLCLDVPVCWRYMYNTAKDLTWATASDVPDIVTETIALAKSRR